MKNKLVDLNNHLFAQLERLSDEDLDSADIEREIRRTDAIVDVSQQIIANAGLNLRAAELVAEYGGKFEGLLPGGDGKAVLEIEDRTDQGKTGSAGRVKP